MQVHKKPSHFFIFFLNHNVDPKKKNAISGKMMYDLAICMDQLLSARAAGEQTIVGLMYRGSGKFFSSGADITLVKEILNTPEMGVAMSDFMTDVITRLRTSGIISLCLLNGPALGGGAELCTGADFRIMADLGPDDTPNGPSNYVAFVHVSSEGFPPIYTYFP
jgi:enoyl-CoA hydratase/carnithine racemase